MNKIIFLLFLSTSCQWKAPPVQETATTDSRGEITSVHTDRILDSLYSYSYRLLNSDVGNPSYHFAEEALTRCADEGDTRCQTLLGYHLINGNRLEKNLESGKRYLRKAASSGNADAILYLSDYYYRTGLIDSCILSLETAHERGFHIATYILSGIYLKGTNFRLGDPQLRFDHVINVEKGMRYLRHAAEEGDLDARFLLANYYAIGLEDQLEIDTAKAVALFTSILKQDDLDSIPGFRDRVEMRLDEITR